MQTVKKYNQKTPTIPVRSSFSFRRQTADDEGEKDIVQKKKERESVCVCGRTPERNDLHCASSSSLSLSLSPALNPPQVKEREDSKDTGQNEEERDLQNEGGGGGGGGGRRVEKHE